MFDRRKQLIVFNLLDLFNDKKIDGVGQYGINLIRGLAQINALSHFHFIIRENDIHIFENILPDNVMTPVKEPAFFKFNLYKKGFLKNFYYNRIKLPKLLAHLKPIILFNPYHSLTCYVPKNIKTVTTYHDLLYLNRSADLSLPKYLLAKVIYKRNIHHSDHIITPSYYVKNDLLNKYNYLDANKITVLANPIYVDKKNFLEYPLKGKYILSVNSILPHKNLITLLKAFYDIMNDIPFNLVLVGRMNKDIDDELKTFIDKIGNKRLIITGYLSNEQRNFLYKNATLFVSPSCHEGFGMTPIEAALFEVPVITTLKTSIPETSLNLLNYHDPPDDHMVLANKILDILKSKKSFEELVDIRKKYEKIYSIESIAKAYFEYFKKIES